MNPKPLNFLETVSKDEAWRLWQAVVRLEPLGAEVVPLEAALGRVLAEDVLAPRDIPPFDRSLVDGFAVRAADSFKAEEESPARLELVSEKSLAGHAPRGEIGSGQAMEIATGGVIPRGANAVQMVERCDVKGRELLIYKAVTPGASIQAAGSDMRAGESVLRSGDILSSRETGVIAALGLASVSVWRRPRVAVISTGDELRAPGQSLEPGAIYDSNSRIVADAARENGCEPVFLGIAPDDEPQLLAVLEKARAFDVVVLSGGTSKGTGDLSFRLIDELAKPGIVVHGVSLKPGKPIVLAAWEGRPVVVLPGFPTSAIITFNLFVRPVLRILAGLPVEEPAQIVRARLPVRLHSAEGRHEYVLVNLVPAIDGLPAAYPVSQASGSMSAFAQADGTVEVGADRSLVLEGEEVQVTLLARALRVPDLVFIGSHCQGVDMALKLLRAGRGLSAKIINVGSTGGVEACARGEPDLAGIHLLDPASGRYNEAALARVPGAVLVRGYRRRQGIYYRAGDFPERAPGIAALVDRGLRLINRGRGAGTRVLLDSVLVELARERGLTLQALGTRIPGYDVEARSHNAVAAQVAAGRADWGVGIESVAVAYGLSFAPIKDEQYDFLVPGARLAREPVQAFLATLGSQAFRDVLSGIPGFELDAETGQVVARGAEAG